MTYTSQDRSKTGRIGGLRIAARRGRPGAAEELEVAELDYQLDTAHRQLKKATAAVSETERRVRDRVAEIVAGAPPLSPAQRTRLAAILAATAGEGDTA